MTYLQKKIWRIKTNWFCATIAIILFTLFVGIFNIKHILGWWSNPIVFSNADFLNAKPSRIFTPNVSFSAENYVKTSQRIQKEIRYGKYNAHRETKTATFVAVTLNNQQFLWVAASYTPMNNKRVFKGMLMTPFPSWLKTPAELQQYQPLPFYLSELDQVEEKNIIYLAVFCIISFVFFMKTWRIFRHPYYYLFRKQLKKDENFVLNEKFEHELEQNLDGDRFLPLKLTSEWLILLTGFAIKMLPLKQIVWVYPERQSRMWGLCFRTNDGRELFAQTGRKSKAEEILLQFKTRFPDLIYGFDKKLDALWDDNPSQFLENARNVHVRLPY